MAAFTHFYAIKGLTLPCIYGIITIVEDVKLELGYITHKELRHNESGNSAGSDNDGTHDVTFCEVCRMRQETR